MGPVEAQISPVADQSGQSKEVEESESPNKWTSVKKEKRERGNAVVCFLACPLLMEFQDAVVSYGLLGNIL